MHLGEPAFEILVLITSASSEGSEKSVHHPKERELYIIMRHSSSVKWNFMKIFRIIQLVCLKLVGFLFSYFFT